MSEFENTKEMVKNEGKKPPSVENSPERSEIQQRFSELESGRIEVLHMAVNGAPLAETLNKLCDKARLHTPEMFCSVLHLNREDNTLHPIASAALPEFYCQALDGVIIGQGVGSCGTAAFTKQRVIVSNINTHPYWAQYKELALSAGLQACWSEPILGANNIVYGTFAMYYAEPKSPEPEELHFIEACAKLAALVYENSEYKSKLVDANKKLEKTLDERTSELEKANAELQNSLNLQSKIHLGNLQLEKMRTTNSLVVGVAHEINTPVGNALTAITTAQNSLNDIINWIKDGTRLSKSQLIQQLEDIQTAAQYNFNNLTKTTDLLGRFKEIDAAKHEDIQSTFDLKLFFQELKSTTASLTGDIKLELDVVSTPIYLSRTALWQVFLQLIENSVNHGFRNSDAGLISIHAATTNYQVIINYQDNGCGIPAKNKEKIFEPFFVDNRESNTLGLGLSIVSNIIKQSFHGEISLIDVPVGTRFEIRLPLTEQPT